MRLLPTLSRLVCGVRFAITFVLFDQLSIVQAANKQLQRTVTRRRGRAARAPFHYARASRFTRQRAPAELRRYTARLAYRSGTMSAFEPK
jgi:hypothetical protein